MCWDSRNVLNELYENRQEAKIYIYLPGWAEQQTYWIFIFILKEQKGLKNQTSLTFHLCCIENNNSALPCTV